MWLKVVPSAGKPDWLLSPSSPPHQQSLWEQWGLPLFHQKENFTKKSTGMSLNSKVAGHISRHKSRACIRCQRRENPAEDQQSPSPLSSHIQPLSREGELSRVDGCVGGGALPCKVRSVVAWFQHGLVDELPSKSYIWKAPYSPLQYISIETIPWTLDQEIWDLWT